MTYDDFLLKADEIFHNNFALLEKLELKNRDNEKVFQQFFLGKNILKTKFSGRMGLV